MRKKLAGFLAAVMTVGMLFTGCGGSGTGADDSANAQKEEQKSDSQEAEEKDESMEDADGTSNADEQVASAEEMIDPVDVVEEGMEPIFGESIKDGVYPVIVDSSSSMFRIAGCELTVKDGQMTAVMTMGGTGYLKVFMGTGEEAVKASEEDYIPFEENENGEHTFTVPVAALDAGISCAAFSRNKEKWYDRTIVFRADSLPQEAFADGVIATVESLGLEDGEYTIEVTLAGGSGRASIESPTTLYVENGEAWADISWNSPNYDYMKIGQDKYDGTVTEDTSSFRIPVSGFDWKMAVIADTTAMSTPHEIAYTLYFDSETLEKE